MHAFKFIDSVFRPIQKSSVSVKNLFRKSGVSLAELGITLAIGSIICVGVGSLFVAVFDSQTTQRQLAVLQNTGLDFVEDLRRDTRTAVRVQLDGADSLNFPSNIQSFGTAINPNTPGNVTSQLRLLYNNPNVNVTYTIGRNTLTRTSNIDTNNGTQIAQRTKTYFPLIGNNNMAISCDSTIASQNEGNGQAGAPIGERANCFSFTKTDLITAAGANGNTDFDEDGNPDGVNVGNESLRLKIGTIRFSAVRTGGAQPRPIDQYGQSAFTIRSVSFEVSGAKTFR
jgi:type II secretory pathway pseudopilin PulG